MTDQSPAPSAPAPESFPELDGNFVPPAPSPVLDASAPKARASESVKAPEVPPTTGDAPATETPAETSTGTEAAPDEGAEPESGPFQFAGRSFKDSAAAEHYLKSQEGRAKSAAKREADLEKKVEEAARAANYYKAEAEKKAQTPEKATEPAKPVEKKSWRENPELWSTVRKLAETEGTDAAMYYALEQAEGNMSKAFDEKLEAALAPYRKDQQQTQLKDYTNRLFEAAENFKDASGTPVYPELNDPAEYDAVVRIWSTLDPTFALTERGVDYAVLRRRAERGGNPPPKAPAPSGAAAKTAEQLAAAANPAPESVSGGGSPRPAPANDAAARSKRVLGDGQRMRTTPSGESLGFID